MFTPMRWRDVSDGATVLLPSGVQVQVLRLWWEGGRFYLAHNHAPTERFPVRAETYVPVLAREEGSDRIIDAMTVLLMAGFTLEHPDPTQRGSAR